MRSLVFNRLLLVSDTQKSGNLFTFRKGYNLITGKNNSIGKSTLIKSLLWAFGCEPLFDSTWKQTDCRTLVEFSINGISYTIYRHQKTIKISTNGSDFTVFEKITGGYSEWWAGVVSFSALLPRRSAEQDEPELETPPPAFYFLPFYIDQIKGWGKLWDSFENLAQYENWKKTIIQYHTGYLSPEHFILEEEIYEKKREKLKADAEISRIDTAVAVVEQYVPRREVSIDEDEFAQITVEVRETLSHLLEEQETVLDKMGIHTAAVYQLKHQLQLIEDAIDGAEKDYVFTVENIEGDKIACPVCGTLHSNSLLDKAGILADKAQLERQREEIAKDLRRSQELLAGQSNALILLKSKIESINAKYSLEDKQEVKYKLSNIIESLASKSIQASVGQTRVAKQLIADKAQQRQKELRKSQNMLLKKENKHKLDAHFTSILAEYIGLLGADGTNLDEVKSPLNHNKLIANGGAAESTRAILAYQMAILDMAAQFGTSILSPFIVDTPNQHEQAKINYESIIKLITDRAPKDMQIILCALDGPLLDSYKKVAHVIELNSQDRILMPERYDQVHSMMSSAIKA